MRIVAGKYRRRLLVWPEDNQQIRPTKDRIREAIFSALGDINSLKALDLYAGSGAMGIEALSRGASHATFVDNNQTALETVKKNIKNLGISSSESLVLYLDDQRALSLFIKEGRDFDIIFIDPPYHFNNYQDLVSKILDNGLLSNNGMIVIESQNNLTFDEKIWKKIRNYKYGDINVDILWREI
ncbi:MAG: 16S rRNA (guanine(966)-N(2))-methyltransferase RsmD [Bacilli bacterium]|jgi:16S rRNA (guanine966-N2)-methyltransferase|nr:16S rRNA (guanine(966)-N(2))-methyltransferase RsmD [Bacilli bacterium]